MADDLLRFFYGGFVRLHILYHANKQPVCGAEIVDELKHHGYSLSPGTLYPILHQMEKAAYLTCAEQVVAGKRRKNYRITREGQALLEDAKDRLRELVSEVLHDHDRMQEP